MMKRLLAGILSIIVLCGVFNFTAFGLGFPMEEAEYGDSNEWLTATQNDVLYHVGVSDWAKISLMGNKADAIVSRGQAAKYICRFAGLSEANTNEFEALFKDLTSEHQFYGAIKAVVASGYMQGDPDGYFRPDEPITTAEMTMVLLRCLNYQPIIAMSGINKALNMTEIQEGVPIGDKVTTAQLFRMLYNALISPAISSNAYAKLKNGDTAAQYVIDENYLGFEHLLGLKYEMAVLDGVPGTNLKAPDTTLKENRITIAGVEYEYEGDASELLGYSVKYLYREASGDRRELVYVYKSDRNEELVLNSDIIDSFENGVYTYEYNNSTRKVSVDAIPIINGVANTYFKDEEMIPDFGTVTLINNDKDSAYDVVKIDNYEFYVSTKILTDKKIVYCEDVEGNSVVLDLNNADSLEIMDKGSRIELNRLKAKQLLAVRKSSDTTPGFKKITIECTKPEKSNAEVTSIKDDTVIMGGSVLKVWDGIKGRLELGKAYNAYVWQDVLVFATELEEEGISTVYLLNYAVEKDNFGSGTAKIAVVDTAQAYHIYDVYEKVQVDGFAYKNETLDSVKTALMNSAQLSAGYDSDYPVAQPVKISFNGKGQVNMIDTFVFNPGEDENSLKPATTYDASGNVVNVGNTQLVYNVRNTALYYTASTAEGYYRSVASVGGAKKLFVPLSERDEVDIYKVDGFRHDKAHLVDVVGIDEETGLAETVFCYFDAGEISASVSPSIVAELSVELNAEGETEYTVKAYQGSTLKTLVCEKDLYDVLNVGDVYTFAVDKNDRIVDKAKRFSPVEGLEGKPFVSAASGSGYLSEVSGSIMGTSMGLASGTLKVALIMPEDINQNTNWANVAVDLFNISTTPVLKFSNINGNPRVETASVAELMTYSQDPANASLVIINKETAMGQVYIIER